MFDFLKRRLKKSVEELAEKAEEKKAEVKEAGIREKIVKTITLRTLEEKDIDKLFESAEPDLLMDNVALEVIEDLKSRLKKQLAGKEIKRAEAEATILNSFKNAIFNIVNVGGANFEERLKSKKPFLIVFFGFNGSGKTTTIAKIAKYLNDKGFKSVIAAADTFRAASIEQIQYHGDRLGIKVIKHQYKADPAAVVFDAVKHAEARGLDVVLADTAGRTHIDKNLRDELKKVVRVNKPDLKVLVIDSLTGNDAVEQARQFNEAVEVDCVVMTKVDVDKKGGSILSVAKVIGKPILFLGDGQGYGDLERFDPQRFAERLLGN